MSYNNLPPLFIEFPGARRIAYHLTAGNLPGVVFLGGFRSDMTGTKAKALEEFCKKRGQRFLRFDYTGHGQSSGNFEQGTIGAWKRDAIAMLDHIAPGPNILVGSSMGGWIMLLAALHYSSPTRGEAGRGAKSNTGVKLRPHPNPPPNGEGIIVGLVGIASAPDFTELLLWQTATEPQKKQLMEQGKVYVPACNDEPPYPITRELVEDGRQHLLLNDDIPLTVPVRLIHGDKDEDVPWQISQKLMQLLISQDVTLTLVKNAGHRLSEPEQLKMIFAAVEDLLILN